jgi:sulfate transport system ATP-binding protein
MVMGADLSARLGLIDAATAQRIQALIARTGLPVRGPQLGAERYLELMQVDKKAEGGEIRFDGENVAGRDARDRNVGFVFQHYALFRHMTVFENVAFGLRVRPRKTRPTAAEIHRRVHALLNLVQLDWLADRYPSQLSGGQRQRIALARALAVEPKVLLLDEPFGALDAKVRKELRRWLRRLHEELHVTSVFVTHDQEEAMEVADRIVVMNRGRIEQEGPPDEVYDHPASPFVLEFLGDVNLLQDPAQGGRADEVSYVRPHEFHVIGEPQDGALPVVFSQALTLGPNTRLEFRRADGDGVVGHGWVDVELPRADYLRLRTQGLLQPGATLYLRPRRVTRFDRHSSADSLDTDPATLL